MPSTPWSSFTRRVFWLSVAAAGLWRDVAAQVLEEVQVERAAPRAWDAAVGAIVSQGPSYPGSARLTTKVTPGLALRWGRVSLASRSAFSVRGADTGAGGGLRVQLASGERLRAGIGLRWTSGRRESDSPELQGLGDVRGTLLLRLNVSYRLDDGWRLRSATTVDALGRGSGIQGDLQLGHDLPLSPSLSWNASVSLGWANRRHLQTYFGITPEQALRAGVPEHRAATGLRDVTLSTGLRQALGPHWTVFGGVSASRLVDEAARSPLNRQRHAWGLGLGLVYRF